jgi:hypothetical protein
MSDVQSITLALGGKWRGYYGLTFCPAHDKTNTPALTLREAADGRLLAKCHSGCDFASIIAALKRLGLLGTGSPSVRTGIRDHYALARVV